jgi:hypothetical protein
MPDNSDDPVNHPEPDGLFERDANGCYRRRNLIN